MTTKSVARPKEREIFNQYLNRKEPSVLVLHGNPGAGKTTFVKDMAKDHNLVHLQTQRNIEKTKLYNTSHGLHFAFQGVPGFPFIPFNKMEDPLRLLERLTNLLVKFRADKHSSKKTILFLDDFTWLFHDENLQSIFNYYIHTIFIIYPELKVVIADDSSELLRKRVIDSEHLKHKIADIIEIKDFDFQQIKEFCGDLDPSKIVLLCGMVGGNPLALDMILNQNIKNVFHSIKHIHSNADFRYDNSSPLTSYQYNFTVYGLYAQLRKYRYSTAWKSLQKIRKEVEREKNLDKPVILETGWDLITGEPFEIRSYRKMIHLADISSSNQVNHMYRQMVINNWEYLVKYLGLDLQQVMFAKPYIIPNDKVDPSIIHLVIQTTDNTVYACEVIYCEEKVTYQHAEAFLKKVARIPKIDKVPLKTVLIAINGFSAEVRYNPKIDYKIELREFFEDK